MVLYVRNYKSNNIKYHMVIAYFGCTWLRQWSVILVHLTSTSRFPVKNSNIFCVISMNYFVKAFLTEKYYHLFIIVNIISDLIEISFDCAIMTCQKHPPAKKRLMFIFSNRKSDIIYWNWSLQYFNRI